MRRSLQRELRRVSFLRVSDTMESTRRWSGYVCPDCRFVFRVPRDHDGKGIVCPSCRRLLRLPAQGDLTPPLLAPVRVVESGGESGDTAPEKVRKRRKGRSSRNSGTPTWEHDSSGHSHGHDTGRQSIGLIVGGAFLFAGIVGAVIFALRPAKESAALPVNPTPIQEAPPVIIKRTEGDLLKDAEALARQFLSARSVEELLPLVRNPSVAGPRIREWHPDGLLQAPGLNDFNIYRMVEYTGPIATVSVTTGDYSTRQLSFMETPEGLKVDWESWSGWSEMTWDALLEEKPAEPKIFRVFIKAADYYNFAFSDENKWQSYRLESSDGNHVIYGYVEKRSITDEKIRGTVTQNNLPMILTLKFPADDTSRNQVIIERHITDGWIEPEGGQP